MCNRRETSRLFFALWPNQKIKRNIVQTFQRLNLNKHIANPHARTIPPHQLHLTLYFMGSVSRENKTRVHKLSQTISCNRFLCNLNCFGYFSSSKILWMGCRETPNELRRLHAELNDKLGKLLLQDKQHSEKSVFKPHITLMRGCSKAEPFELAFSIPWVIKAFSLVESHINQDGPHYQIIGQYPLH